jgi:hypothetical protein
MNEVTRGTTQHMMMLEANHYRFHKATSSYMDTLDSRTKNHDFTMMKRYMRKSSSKTLNEVLCRRQPDLFIYLYKLWQIYIVFFIWKLQLTLYHCSYKCHNHFLYALIGVKCTSGPQTCAHVSSRSTNSKSVSSWSLNVVRISLRSKRVSIMSTKLSKCVTEVHSCRHETPTWTLMWCKFTAEGPPRRLATPRWAIIGRGHRGRARAGPELIHEKLPARHDLHGHRRGTASDGAGEAATRVGEVEARRELLGLRREVWAWVWVVGRQSPEGQTPARHEPHDRPRCNRVGLRPFGGAQVLLDGDECHISMPCCRGLWVWTCLDLSDTRTTYRDRDDTLFEFVDRVDTGAQVWGPLVHFTPLIDIGWTVLYLIFGKLVGHFFVFLLVFRVFLFVSF